MQVKRLDHVNLRTTQLNTMVQWYNDVLGLQSGPRPTFPFPGAWLYAGEHAVVHLVEIDPPDALGSEKELKLEHFAFTASGAQEFEARLKAHGQEYKRVEVADTQMAAFNVWDPDGNHIHVDFALAE